MVHRMVQYYCHAREKVMASAHLKFLNHEQSVSLHDSCMHSEAALMRSTSL